MAPDRARALPGTQELLLFGAAGRVALHYQHRARGKAKVGRDGCGQFFLARVGQHLGAIRAGDEQFARVEPLPFRIAAVGELSRKVLLHAHRVQVIEPAAFVESPEKPVPFERLHIFGEIGGCLAGIEEGFVQIVDHPAFAVLRRLQSRDHVPDAGGGLPKIVRGGLDFAADVARLQVGHNALHVVRSRPHIAGRGRHVVDRGAELAVDLVVRQQLAHRATALADSIDNPIDVADHSPGRTQNLPRIALHLNHQGAGLLAEVSERVDSLIDAALDVIHHQRHFPDGLGRLLHDVCDLHRLAALNQRARTDGRAGLAARVHLENFVAHEAFHLNGGHGISAENRPELVEDTEAHFEFFAWPRRHAYGEDFARIHAGDQNSGPDFEGADVREPCRQLDVVGEHQAAVADEEQAGCEQQKTSYDKYSDQDLRSRGHFLNASLQSHELANDRVLASFQLVGRTAGQNAAAVENGDFVSDPPGAGNVVGDDHHGSALNVFEVEKKIIDFLRGDGVEPAARLVGEKNRRIEREGAGKSDALLHAAGYLRRHFVVDSVKADARKFLLDALADLTVL